MFFCPGSVVLFSRPKKRADKVFMRTFWLHTEWAPCIRLHAA